jgi:hypothetical protein
LGLAVLVLASTAGIALAVEATTSPPPATVPQALGALEQRMAQIRFNTARISVRSVLGELGSPAGGAELGSDINKCKSLVTSGIGEIRLSPAEGTFTGRSEGLIFQGKSSLVTKSRTIGKTNYTYEPSVESYDGRRPWVRSRQHPPPKPGSKAAQLSAIYGSLAPTFAASEGESPGPTFTKLIDDLNSAVSIQEGGLITVDGQQTTEFTASLSLVKLLAGELSPKQLAAIEQKPSEATVGLEVFIAPNGLPVRTTGVTGGRIEGLGIEEDILALEVPVVVHAPPASKTIGQAQLRKLENKRLKRELKKLRHIRKKLRTGKPVRLPKASPPPAFAQCLAQGEEGDGGIPTPKGSARSKSSPARDRESRLRWLASLRANR